MIDVRDANVNDRDDVLACWRDLYNSVAADGGVQASPAAQQDRLLSAFDAVLGRRLDGVCLVVGNPVQAFTMWAVTDLHEHPTLGRYAEGLATYVAPALRGKGVASTLWSTANARLRALGVVSLVGLTEATNKPMQALLKSQGFVPAQIVYTAPLGPLDTDKE